MPDMNRTQHLEELAPEEQLQVKLGNECAPGGALIVHFSNGVH